MINILTEEIINSSKPLDVPEEKIFKIKRRIRMLENGGLDKISLLRLFMSLLAIILDLFVLLTNGAWINGSILLIIITALFNVTLFASSDILLEAKYLIRAIKIREKEHEFENANIYVLQGSIIEKNESEIKISTLTGTSALTTEVYRLKEKLEKYKAGTNIVCCYIEDGGTFEILDCMTYDSYKLKAVQQYRTYRIKNSRAYKTGSGIIILLIAAYILSLIISLSMK